MFSLCGLAGGSGRDDGHRPATVGSLMFGATGDEHICSANGCGDHAADDGTGMSGCIDIAVVDHDVAVAADFAGGRRLGLAKHGVEPGAGRIVQLRGRTEAGSGESTLQGR